MGCRVEWSVGSQGRLSEEGSVVGVSPGQQEWWTHSSVDLRGSKRFWKVHGECGRRQEMDT